MKKFLRGFFSVVFCIVLLVGIAVGGFFIFYTPSLTADFSQKTGEVTSGASGYLYGLAEDGVPSYNMTESIDISSVAQKVTDGLQHPIGDISHVSSQLDNTDYNIVYLQDNYSTWYYDQDNIEKMRSEGTYDWKTYLEETYLPMVESSVKKLSATDYSDKVVYCLYNECDNGVWFGETKQGENCTYGVYGEYNEQGAQNFFEAWKITYDFVKSINPDAIIGGPGFCDYDSNEIQAFLEFCIQNDCVPQIMIYHELGDYSVRFWKQHVSDYREIEKSLGLDELTIIVSEYGRMCDNGLPGTMLQYITQIEDTKVYADNAYWRLADNLCDVAGDANSPNSNWWVYRWYTDMEGQTVSTSYQDLMKSNFENAFIKRKAEYTSWGFMGIASINDSEDEIDIICGGRDGSAVVKLKNLDETNLYGKTVSITIEEAVYEGLSGIVNSPRTVSKTYTQKLKSSLTIDMNDMDEANAYHIVIKVEDSAGENYKNDTYLARYEFETGELLGGAYTYNSAYATTGEEEGMLGGMENLGDGVRLTFNVPEDSTYDLKLIYGNSNDGEWDENGVQSSDDRVDSISKFILDGNEETLSFPNTIKSEYTDCYTITTELASGEHTIEISQEVGTIVLDSLLVEEHSDDTAITVLDDGDRSVDGVKSYLAIAPEDDYYIVNSNGAYDVKINDNEGSLAQGDNAIYLMRGLNYIDLENGEGSSVTINAQANDDDYNSLDNDGFTANKLTLSDGATLAEDIKGNEYITGIDCNGGSASFDFYAKTAGTYAITFDYSNNAEGGKHAYNVDLIERYVTVTANGTSQDVYCRNTYSWGNYKTVTCYVDLKKGDNTITLTNSGNNKFDSQDTVAPNIYSLTVNQISK